MTPSEQLVSRIGVLMDAISTSLNCPCNACLDPKVRELVGLGESGWPHKKHWRAIVKAYHEIHKEIQ